MGKNDERAKAERGVSRDRLRVVHVVPGLGLGGAETLLYNLVSQGKAIDHRVICLGQPSWYSDKLEAAGIPVRYLHLRRMWQGPVGLKRLVTALRRDKPDVVQAWLYVSNLFAGVAARMIGVPVVWGIHCLSFGPFSRTTRRLGWLGGRLAPRFADYVVSCSLPAQESHAGLGYASAPGGIIANGYDSGLFAPNETKRRKTRKELGIKPGDFVIGCIGRWDPFKDIPTLLRGLRIAVDEGIPVKGLLVGEGLGPNNSALADLIEEAGCSAFVKALGKRPDIPDIARALDLHVLSSVSESFGNTVAETMLSGTPNLVTDSGGPAMVVGDTGWIVPPREPELLAGGMMEAWREMSEQPDVWKDRRAAARARIVDNFSFAQMAEEYERVWRETAKHGRKAKRPEAER